MRRMRYGLIMGLWDGEGCSQHLNCIELQFANFAVYSRTKIHAFRTDWALTVLHCVSLLPIKSRRRCVWPMTASCNWVDLLQVSFDQFTSVHVSWNTEQALKVRWWGGLARTKSLTFRRVRLQIWLIFPPSPPFRNAFLYILCFTFYASAAHLIGRPVA